MSRDDFERHESMGRNVDVDDPEEQLGKLSELEDYEVAEGQTDVRGWQVVGREGAILGQVDDLIADPQVLRVRYLSVALPDREVRDRSKPYRLVPIGLATIDREDKVVVVGNVDFDALRDYPAYDGGPISHEFSVMLRKAYMGGAEPGVEVWRDVLYDPAFYERSEFDEDRFYNRNRPGPTEFRGKSAGD